MTLPNCYRCQSQPCTCRDGISLYNGDCLDVMRAMEPESVTAIVTDPPYGLEFMGQKWDKLKGDAWRTGAGMSQPGIGERSTPWVSYGSGDNANATCATCGGRMRGAKKCSCAVPDWKVKGKPLGVRNAKAEQGQAMYSWHLAWATEALRVAKPGAMLLAFGGTRTHHRLMCAIEDAGWEIRDCIMWVYGSGFPKSLDVSKAIDKAGRRDFVEAAIRLGVQLPGRSVDDWTKENHAPGDKWWEKFKASLPPDTWNAIEREVVGRGKSGEAAWFGRGEYNVTAPATDAAKLWNGWGTALKPAVEIIVVCMKPLDGTFAANALKHGVAGINVDGCRVGTEERTYDLKGGENLNKLSRPDGNDSIDANGCGAYGIGAKQTSIGQATVSGRWPANIIHDGSDEVLAGFPETTSGKLTPEQQKDGGFKGAKNCYGTANKGGIGAYGASSGSAARFFYTAKADSAERGPGNTHPTVKPLDLMSYLCKLVSQPGYSGTILDPFTGSGSTLLAASRWFAHSIGIEQESRYCDIAARRLEQEVLFI